MKKNISINLFGTLYAIDEDAYTLLERYLNSMKSYFSRQEGGEEIADDIEHRVAELLWQEKEKGVDAVNIEMIRDIMNKIGDPAQIDSSANPEKFASTDNTNSEESNRETPLDSHPFADGGSRSNNGNNQTNTTSSGESNDNIFNNIKRGIKDKRLYRDTEDKMIGGVCSGLSHYFGGDVTIWRLAIVVSAILLWYVTDIWWVPGVFGWIIPLGYLVLCCVVPIANTPEDQLRMRGEDVSPHNINQEILRESNATQQQMYSQQAPNNGSGCLKALLIVGAIIILFPLIASIISVVLGMSLFSGIVGSGLMEHIFGNSEEGLFIGQLLNSMQGMIWVVLLCLIALCLIPLILIIMAIRGKKISGTALLCSGLLWLAALIAGIFFTSRTFGEITNAAINADYAEWNWHVGPYSYKRTYKYTVTQNDDTLVNIIDSVENSMDSILNSIDSVAAKIDAIN